MSVFRTQSSSSSFSSWILVLAATAASPRGLNTAALGFSGTEIVSLAVSRTVSLSQAMSSGYKCWTGRSIVPCVVLSSTARMMPSLPGKIALTMASGQVPRFLLSVLMMTTSPTLGLNFASLWVRLWRSRRAARYSRFHRFQRFSLQVFKYFARFLRSGSPIRHVSCSGIWLVRWNRKLEGVRIGNSTSSST